MLSCYQKSHPSSAIPITPILKTQYNAWLKDQSAMVQAYLKSVDFKAKAGKYALLMSPAGELIRVLLILDDLEDMWMVAGLPLRLPQKIYYLDAVLTNDVLNRILIGWGLGAYQFTNYKKAERKSAKLVLSRGCYVADIENQVEAVYFVRDLINTPADDMGPTELAKAMFQLAEESGAQFQEVLGEALLVERCCAIHAAGRGSDDAPRLLDLRWGDPEHKKVTLVGKGVCFDSGGLNLKMGQGMTGMKKDMGGAAHVLGLAKMIMQAKLPICLRVLIPAIENSVSGEAMHPGDVITTRSGKTVEVKNTDAEGRLILADALDMACEDKPDLLVDFATLTGAARVALGTEIAMQFSHDQNLAHELLSAGDKIQDEVWPMPLHDGYNKWIKSDIADLSNSSSQPYGGAITAALFLNHFVAKRIPWVHFDIMGANVDPRPGRPKGGEAQMVRGLFQYLREFF